LGEVGKAEVAAKADLRWRFPLATGNGGEVRDPLAVPLIAV
jgi:hypothetical protein